jgi:hypothetical protein
MPNNTTPPAATPRVGDRVEVTIVGTVVSIADAEHPDVMIGVALDGFADETIAWEPPTRVTAIGPAR